MVHGVVLLQIAVYFGTHAHDQTHIVAVERQSALEDETRLVARLNLDGVFEVVTRNAHVCLRVEHLVADGGEVALFLRVPCRLDAVVLRLLVVFVENRGLENGRAVVDANDIERQVHLLLITCGQGEVLLVELHFGLQHLKVQMVSVAGLC